MPLKGRQQGGIVRHLIFETLKLAWHYIIKRFLAVMQFPKLRIELNWKQYISMCFDVYLLSVLSVWVG